MGRILKELAERSWLCPILQIHDELVFELPETHLKEAVSLLKNCMEVQPFDTFSVPIVAEASVGQRFGELEEIEVNKFV